MVTRAHVRLLIFALLTGMLAAASFAAPREPKRATTGRATQTGFFRVIVNGRQLTGPNSSAETRGGRIFVPVAAIARVLGDRIEVESARRVLRVDRQDGAAVVFDAHSGQVRENNVAVLTLSNLGEIVFPPNLSEVLLPVELASAIFSASIRYDTRQNLVVVLRGRAPVAVRTTKRRRSAELYRAEYEVNASGYSGSIALNLVLNSTGRIADGRFYLRSNASGNALGRARLRNVTFDLERPNGQRFVAGDFGSGASSPLMTSQVRGGMVSLPITGINVNIFGGRTNSGTVLFANEPADSGISRAPQGRVRFDTGVLGAAATKVVSPQLGLSAGVMRFRGPNRSGAALSASANLSGRKLQMQADVGAGRFRGWSSDGKPVDGIASAIDLTGTYQIAEQLTVHARFTEIGGRFLTPQAGIREPLSLRAAGASYSPVSWLSASVNASTARRPNEPGRAESFVTAAFGISPGGHKPRFYMSHTASRSLLYRSGAFTLINASKEFSRWRIYLNAVRTKTIGRANANLQVGANLSISDTHSLEASQGFGSRRTMNGMIDWRGSGLVGRRLSLTAGLGYNYTNAARFSLFQRVTTSLKLPRESSLHISYMNTVTGSAVLVQLRGAIFKRRESAAFVNAPLTAVTSLSSVAGRVYQDVDDNGVYEPGVDKPQSAVKVRVDGNRYAVTDANGSFSFDAVPAGTHSVYLDLLSVRADLTLIDGAARDLELTGGRTTGLDFRLVRTGRITGRVFLDRNGNGALDEGESPLADVRVVTASGRDTLTDAQGFFAIADLPPGEHVVFLDEKTLPDKTVAARTPTAVQVFAGKETNGVDLISIPAPAEVKRFSNTN